MSGPIGNLITVQGVGNPVPAAFGGEQAGPRPSTSSNRNVSAVGNLAAYTLNATSTHPPAAKGAEAIGEATDAKHAFSRSNRMARSPVRVVLGSAPVLPLIDLDPKPGTASGSDGNVIEKRLHTLGSHIEDLQLYVKDRNNVHHEIKRMLRLIKTSFSELEKEMKSKNIRVGDTPKQQNKGGENSIGNWILKTQTRDLFVEDSSTAIMATPSGPGSTSGDSVKRRRERGGDTSHRTPEQKRQRNDTRFVKPEKKKEIERNIVTDSEDELDVNPEEWKKVTTKKKGERRVEVHESASNGNRTL